MSENLLSIDTIAQFTAPIPVQEAGCCAAEILATVDRITSDAATRAGAQTQVLRCLTLPNQEKSCNDSVNNTKPYSYPSPIPTSPEKGFSYCQAPGTST